MSSKTPGGPRTRVILKYGNSEDPQTNVIFGFILAGGPPGPSGRLDIVHPVHLRAAPLHWPPVV